MYSNKSNKDKNKELRRRILLKKREEIVKEIADQLGQQINDELQRRIDSALDLGDQAIRDLEEEIGISLLDMKNKVRKEIDDALRRLDEGTYGICTECGEEISEGRLKVVPFATHCIKCQEKLELIEKIEKEEERG